MVRVWKPGGAEPALGLHGTATHLGSGDTVTFTEPRALLLFLARSSRDVPPMTVTPDEGHDRDAHE